MAYLTVEYSRRLGEKDDEAIFLFHTFWVLPLARHFQGMLQANLVHSVRAQDGFQQDCQAVDGYSEISGEVAMLDVV